MKKKDLDKHLEYLIIDGLIKEAEQDNADFEAAMRKMSDEEFDELIYQPSYVNAASSPIKYSNNMSIHLETSDYLSLESAKQEKSLLCYNYNHGLQIDLDDNDIADSSKPKSSKNFTWKVFRPWITSAVAAAAIILIILIPSINVMNGKLCDSALYASEAYMTPTKGGINVTNVSAEELKSLLPELEKKYESCIKEEGKVTYYSGDLQEAGWDLTLAYLKLHKKGDAVRVLKVLSDQYNGTPFGDHCQIMLKQL